MRFRNTINRNNQSSGMNKPYEYRQNRHRTVSANDRFRKQENSQGEDHIYRKDKNSTDDFVVLSLEEIRSRKSNSSQNISSSSNPHNRTKEETKINKEDNSERIASGDSLVEAPDYEMSEEEAHVENSSSKSEQSDTQNTDTNAGNDWDSTLDDSANKNIDAPGTPKHKNVNIEEDKKNNSNHNTPEQQHAQSSHSNVAQNETPDYSTRTKSPPDSTRNPWLIQEQVSYWGDSEKKSNDSYDEKRPEENQAKNDTSENNGRPSGDYNRRITRHQLRDDNQGYYPNNNRQIIRDDDRNTTRGPMQRSNEYRNDYGGRQNQTPGHASNYDRNNDRNPSYNKSWNNNWQYNNKTDAKQQNPDLSDPLYRYSSKLQTDTFSSHYQPGQTPEYDDNARNSGRSNTGTNKRITGGNYMRKYMRFNNPIQTFRPQHNASNTSINNEESDAKKYPDRNRTDYDSNFQRNTNKRLSYISTPNKDNYNYQVYPRDEVPRCDPRYSSRPLHISNNDGSDSDLQQNMRITDSYHRGIRQPPPKRTRPYTHTPQRDSLKDDSDDVGVRDGVYEPETAMEDMDFGSDSLSIIERDIMLQPFPASISSYMRLIDTDKKVNFDICKKILVASAQHEEVQILRKVFSYMQQEYRDLLKHDEYLPILQCYALIGDSQNLKAIREYANLSEINMSVVTWAQILRYVCGARRLTPEVIKIIVDSIMKTHVTQSIIPYTAFLLQICLDNLLTEESLAIFHRFAKASASSSESVFDTSTSTNLLKHLLNLNDFKSAYLVIQTAYSTRHDLDVNTSLEFVFNCLYKRDNSHLAKQAYLIIRKHCRFVYKNLKILQDISELFANAHLVPEAIAVIKDIILSSLPITDTEVLITLLNNVSTVIDRKEVINLFKHIFSQRFLMTTNNLRLYEELARLIFKSATPENVIWLKNHLIESCVTLTPTMEKFLFNSDRSFINKNEVI